jgi:copper chaperone CopZ
MKGKSKLGLIAGAIVIAAVLSISFVAAKNEQVGERNGLETTLRVARLTCGACLGTIEGELRKFDGMLGMRADLSQGLVTVSHTAAFAPQKIAAVITDAGYPAQLLAEAGSVGLAPTGGCGSGRGCGSGGCGLPAAAPAKS